MAAKSTSTPSKGKRGSKLSKTTNQRRNTQSGRERMSRSTFAVPKGKGKHPDRANYRLDTAAHARNVLARVSQHGTPQEKRMVRRKVAAKYPSIGTSKSGSKR